MATRDLTVTYQRQRSALQRSLGRRDEASGVGLLGAAAGASGVDSAPLVAAGASPVYVEMVTDVQNDLGSIGSKMETLGQLHDQRLRIGFDPAAESEMEARINVLTAEIQRLFAFSAAKLKRLTREASMSEGAESKVLQNIQRAVAARLHEQSTDFRRMQKAYLAQIKRMAEGQSFSSILGGGGGVAALDRDMGFTDEQVHELATAEEDADERVREIQRIAKSVEELATLFKDLATLVVEQGTILDRIDANMEQAAVAVRQGLAQVKEADKYQKSAQPFKCMIVLMILITVMTVVIIIRKTS